VGEVLGGIGSVKGSPGATTTALGLASVWPESVLLVEADPSGGDVGLWRGVGSDPGLVSLAGAARRRRPGDVDVLDHAHELGPGLWLVPGPAGPDQAQAAVRLLADRTGLLPSVASTFDGSGTVIVDLGRLDPASPARGLLPGLDVLLLTGRATVAELTHLAAAAPDLADAAGGALTGVVLTQGCRYRTREIEEALGVPLLAVLPADPATATMLAGGGSAGTGIRRRGRGSPLLSTLGELAPRLLQSAQPRERATEPAAATGPLRPQLPAGEAPASPARPGALPNKAVSGPASRVSGSRTDAGSVPTRRAPRTAEEAGWIRSVPAEPPGTASTAGRGRS
jgi:hypothetical protein